MTLLIRQCITTPEADLLRKGLDPTYNTLVFVLPVEDIYEEVGKLFKAGTIRRVVVERIDGYVIDFTLEEAQVTAEETRKVRR